VLPASEEIDQSKRNNEILTSHLELIEKTAMSCSFARDNGHIEKA
jgi:hypothetical protein